MKMKSLRQIYSSARNIISQRSGKRFLKGGVELVGDNWLFSNKKPVAIMYGFNPWKREVVSQYLSDYRTAFVRGKTPFYKLKYKFLNHLSDDEQVVFIGWGNKLPESYKRYANARRLAPSSKTRSNVATMEDGFLRSIGVGLLHTRPGSLCLDWEGIHFKSKGGSDLETLLNDFDFAGETALIKRAEKCMELMRAARLTKYYNPKPYDKTTTVQKLGRYSILVIGQVEDDASVLNSGSKVLDNYSLVLQAKKDFPEANIYFRPHPDYWTGTRDSTKTRKLESLENICAIVPPTISLYALFDVVDRVYTISSLSGFEALVHGLEVTTLGAPFYSNWGVTDDKVKVPKRTAKRTVAEIFAIAYLIYPRYISMVTSQRISYEELAEELILESLKHEMLLDFKKNALFQAVRPHKESLSSGFELLEYLVESESFGGADPEFFFTKLVPDRTCAEYERAVRYFPYLSVVLINSSNFEVLTKYIELCLHALSDHSSTLFRDAEMLENLFYYISLSLYHTNGRVVDGVPDFIGSIEKFVFCSPDRLERIYKLYFKILSANLQYELAKKVYLEISRLSDGVTNEVSFRAHQDIDSYIRDQFVKKIESEFSVYTSLGSSLTARPSRSERDYVSRHSLLVEVTDRYHEGLDKKFNDEKDVFVNAALKAVLLGDETRATTYAKKISEVIGWDRIVSEKVRIGDAFSLFNYFIRRRNYTIASDILPHLLKINNVASSMAGLNYYRSVQDDAGFFSFYSELEEDVRSHVKVLAIYARQLRNAGLFSKSKRVYKEILSKPATVAKKTSIQGEIDKIDFCIESSEILNSVPQPRLPKGVVFLASQTCFNTLAMMVPSLVELKKEGYAVVNLCSGMTEEQPTGIDFIDRFFGVIPLDLVFSERKNEWLVDWPARRVESKGINFYQGFYERLSTSARRFFVDINNDGVWKDFEINLLRSDTCLSVCDEIYRSVTKKGIPTVFVSGNSHVTPFSVFRDYARFKNDRLLTFVNCNVAYEAYFSNLGSKTANTMCVTDMTLYPDVRAPFMARHDKFKAWYEKNKKNGEFVEKANSIINVNRVGQKSLEAESALLERISTAKNNGVKVVCAFGKVPVDLNVPYDGGAAHSDMSDWITHTVETIANKSDVLLLIKPHPHELRPEIALDLVESFFDLIKCEIPENVVLMGHKDMNSHALGPYLDLALLYNGSTALELTTQGVPVVMASYFGKHDYPVSLQYPESRDDYEQLVLSEGYRRPTEEIQKQAAFLICYLGTDEITTLNQFSIRQLTNDKIGVPKWRRDKVKEFLLRGDVGMKKIASQIVEKFEL
ncbi:hypothetical protein EVC62_14755 [Salinicola endophyticus]|uniref:Capsule polysaccharide biosynthesis protein n=1 Tax=Salinicola endophyticus TaxID=1949083 RepID=A0ABY8FS02_9GAMM|nr:hypothetical protein [Salinicola endophyticus]WFF42654.1 hypothetical protein EVC62_14755 [Salinicola endophyticus]